MLSSINPSIHSSMHLYYPSVHLCLHPYPSTHPLNHPTVQGIIQPALSGAIEILAPTLTRPPASAVTTTKEVLHFFLVALRAIRKQVRSGATD
jgi:hypothetical protein